ncbi:amino acid transport gap1 [Fusarium coicis]|nr:amino acid transport gap1 [Fusarium coicis]
MGAAQSAQSEALANLLQTGDYSDLTITCGKDQYRVHKAIICPRSSFFKAACDGKFKEAQTGKVDLRDDDPLAVSMMIEYLYCDTYEPPSRNHTVDAHLSETEYNNEQKRKLELYGATFVGNKRVKRLTAPSGTPITSISQPVPSASGTLAAPPPPPPSASQAPGRGRRDRSKRGRGSLGGINSPSGHNSTQASPNQSPSTPGPPPFASPAPAPTPPPPPQPSAPPRPILTQNLHLHAKVYALGEKYGIKPLKALALRKFEAEAPFRIHTDDFLEAIREAYTSTIETDRPLRDAVVAILRSNKNLLKKDSVKAVLKDPGLGLSFDIVMAFASD